MAEFQYILYLITGTLTTYWELMLTFLPILLLVEVPLLLLIFIGILHWSWGANEVRKHEHPSISFIVTCYAEGKEIEKTIATLVEQIYPNHIEILVVIDGAKENKETYRTAISLIKNTKIYRIRPLKFFLNGNVVDVYRLLMPGYQKQNMNWLSMWMETPLLITIWRLKWREHLQILMLLLVEVR